MVKVNDPNWVGIPLKVFPVSVTPAGKAPDVTAKVYGAVPPVAVSVRL